MGARTAAATATETETAMAAAAVGVVETTNDKEATVQTGGRTTHNEGGGDANKGGETQTRAERCE